MREGIPLEKDNNRWERGALMLSITAKEKNYRKVFSFDYFHLRFSIAYISLKLINTNNHAKETGENLKPYIWNKKNREFSHKVFGGGGSRKS